jgi:hypothetical protein
MLPFVAALLRSLHWMSHLMRSTFTTLLLLGALTCSAHAQTYVSLGYGGVSCAAWAFRKPIESKAYEAWLYGYLSSYNAFVFKGPNVIDGMSEEQVRGWVDAYCKKSPGQNLDAAVRALIEQQTAGQSG